MIKFILFIIFIFFILLFIYSSKYNNPYKLVMIYGKKGSGKTTFLTKQSIFFNKKGWHVFSNVEIFGAYKLDTDWIGRFDFPEKSLLLIDEVGLVWDNRNFKSFPNHVRDFFKLQRHKKVYVIMASQAFDIDKKLRDLTDEMYLLQNVLNIFTIAKKINKFQTISNTDNNNDTDKSDSVSCLVESYKFAPFFDWIYTFNPRYFKFFNSFECDKLPDVNLNKYKFNDFAYLYTLTNNRKFLKTYLIDKFYLYKNRFYLSKLDFNISFNLYYYFNTLHL